MSSGIESLAALAESQGCGARRGWPEKLRRRSSGVDCHFHEAVQHLLPGLFAIAHFGLGVRIRWIVRRIVVVPDALQHRAGGKQFRGLQVVIYLPAEIVAWNAQQNLRLSGG